MSPGTGPLPGALAPADNSGVGAGLWRAREAGAGRGTALGMSRGRDLGQETGCVEGPVLAAGGPWAGDSAAGTRLGQEVDTGVT